MRRWDDLVQLVRRCAPRPRGGARPLVVVTLALTLALGGCSFTTDTAATVGPERITVGEFNAAVAQLRAFAGEAEWAQNGPEYRREALDRLVENRLIALEARQRRVDVSADELETKLRADLEAASQGVQQQRQQSSESLATQGAGQLRPIVNSYGGTAIADADLVALLRAEIARMQSALSGTSQAFASGVPETMARDRAASLATGLAGKGAAVPAAALEPTLAALAAQLAQPGTNPGETFRTGLTQSGLTSTSAYRIGARRQLLEQKLRPLYLRPVEAVTLQQLITDSREKAQDALTKARAGQPFEELVKQAAIESARGDQVVNGIGSVVPDFFPETVRALFPSLQPGAYSEVAPVRGPNGTTAYRFFRVTKTERRDPTPDELGGLRQLWLDTLRAKYPVIESPALQLPPRTQ